MGARGGLWTKADGSKTPRTPERIAYERDWRERNRERVRAVGRKYAAEHREARLKKSAQWRRSVNYSKRRGRTQGDYRAMAIALLVERDGPLCGICRAAMAPRETTIDHIKPVVQGGSNDALNLRLAHLICNLERPRGPKRATPTVEEAV